MQKQFASFYLDETLCGIDVLLVREINKNLDITPVDPSPDFIAGLMNLRGQIVTLANLNQKFGFTHDLEEQEERESCCIVLKTDKELERLRDEGLVEGETSKDIVGLLVDRIGDMVTVDEYDIERPPANVNGLDGQYLSGVIKLENELLAIIDVSNMLKM